MMMPRCLLQVLHKSIIFRTGRIGRPESACTDSDLVSGMTTRSRALWQMHRRRSVLRYRQHCCVTAIQIRSAYQNFIQALSECIDYM